MKKDIICSIFGHRRVSGLKNVQSKLVSKLEELIGRGVNTFLVGINGEFDKLAISTLRMLKEIHPKIKIFIVVSDLSKLSLDKFGYSKLSAYADLKVISYEIENIHFKNRITFSNKKMVEQSDIVLCYVDFKKNNSGAKKAVLYAKKSLKEIVNIFEESNNVFYGLTQKEVIELFEKTFIMKD